MSVSAFIDGAVAMVMLLWPPILLVTTVALLCYYRYRGSLAE